MARRTPILLVVILLAAPLVAAGTPRTESEPYVLGSKEAPFVCNETVVGWGVAGACFTILTDETTVTITIDDVSGQPVGASYSVMDRAGETQRDSGSFCGSTTLDIDQPADEIVVRVHGGCEGSGILRAAGTIGVSFS